MIYVLTMIAGASIFFVGFCAGIKYGCFKPHKAKQSGTVAAGEVITNKEYLNFLSYDGTQQN